MAEEDSDETILTAAVDVHAHSVPPGVERAAWEDPHRYDVWPEAFEGTPTRLRVGRRLLRPIFDAMVAGLGDRLLAMGQCGTTHQILSVWPDLFAYEISPRHAQAWHALVNHELEAAAVGDPSFSWLCALTMQAPDLASAELEEAVSSRGASGAIIGSNIAGMPLSDHRFDQVWSTACRLDVPVVVHPIEPADDGRLVAHNLRAIVGYIAETSTALAGMILDGTFDRFPDLKLVSVHGGGALPYQIGRLDRGHHLLRRSGAVCREAPSAYLRRLHFDSVTHSPDALRYLIDVVGVSQVVMGSDCPFSIGDPAPRALIESCRLDPLEEAAVLDGNARTLFGLSLGSSPTP